jgi:D-galactarolactone cycloisomerase
VPAAVTGRAIRSVESFVIRHQLSPRTGPSIAFSSEHAYVIVKVTDGDGLAGWGETYLIPGVVSIVEEVGALLLGRPATSLRALVSDVRWAAEHPYAASALAIAIEDLRARQLGCSVADSFGGAIRDRVRVYAASGGYVEGVDPSETWPAEAARLREAGYTAMKLRIGGYPIDHEAPLLERLRADLPAEFALMADGNAAYTYPDAVRMGRVLERLGFVWFEEPLRQREGYVGYERLHAGLGIALAAGEILLNRSEAESFLSRGCSDIVQPEPVICGGIGETLFIGELAAVHAVTAMPHTSNSAIGIAAGLQVLACLPDPTRSPASPQLFLEHGVDDNPHRSALLKNPFRMLDGFVSIPEGPGLGVEVDEDYLRHHATEVRESRP